MKRFLLLSCVVFAWIALSLVGAELFLRYVYAPDTVKIRLRMNQLAAPAAEDASLWGGFSIDEFRFAPHAAVTIAHQEFRYRTTHDTFGWRNPCAREPADFHIVGDSFIYGIGGADEAMWDCNLLSHGKRAYLSGIPGAGPSEYLKMIEKNKHRLVSGRALKEDATLILALFAGNDYEGLLRAPIEVRAGAQPTTSTSASAIATTIRVANDTLVRGPLRNVHVLQLAKVSLYRMINSIYPRSVYTHYGSSTFYVKDLPIDGEIAQVERFFGGLKDFAHNLKYRRVVIMLIPEAAEVLPKRLRRDAQIAGFDPERIDTTHKYSVITAAAARTGLPLIDLRGSLSDERFFYEHDGHLTNIGLRVASKALAENLYLLCTETPAAPFEQQSTGYGRAGIQQQNH